MAVVFKTDGTRESLYKVQLEDLQKAVGGNIEMVYADQDHILVINEEGKLMGLPFNRTANDKVKNTLLSFDTGIVGDAVWITRSDHPELFEDEDDDYDYGYFDEQGDY